jgi:uncharacterized membrane protein YqjE
MSESSPPPSSGSASPRRSGSTPPGFGGDIRRLLADLVEMVRVRRDLAEYELRADLVSSKRLGLFAGVGGVLLVTSLPLLLIAAAQVLDRWRPLGAGAINGWVPLLGGALFVTGALLAWSGYRRFRRDFHGFRQSLAELREDVEQLQEWARGGEPVDGEE